MINNNNKLNNNEIIQKINVIFLVLHLNCLIESSCYYENL